MSQTPDAAPSAPVASWTAPTLSVALCTRNGADYVAEQVASILAQRPAPMEIVVGDDASTDGTVAVIEAEVARARAAEPQLATELVIRRHEQPLGVSGNFADAMASCRGELIALSDQDDVWAPGKLPRLVPLFADPEVLLVHSDARLVDRAGAPLGITLLDALEATPGERAGLETGESFPVLLRRNLVAGATMVLRRSLFEAASPLPAEWVHDEWLAAYAAALSPHPQAVTLVPEPLIDYRQHGANEIGARKATVADKWERLREPRDERAPRLARRAAVLAERLAERGAGADRVAAARAKAHHEAARAALPRLPLARWPRVLAWAAQGRYARYSRGAIDVLRDLVQPAGPPRRRGEAAA